MSLNKTHRGAKATESQGRRVRILCASTLSAPLCVLVVDVYSTVTLCGDWLLVEIAGARPLSTRHTEAQRPRSRRAAECEFSVPLRSPRLCVSCSSTFYSTVTLCGD